MTVSADSACLFTANHPSLFWKLSPPQDDLLWKEAMVASAHLLPFVEKLPDYNADTILDFVLGEGYLGTRRWRTSGLVRELYRIRRFVPSRLVAALRTAYQRRSKPSILNWPHEERYAEFLFATLRHVIEAARITAPEVVGFWPRAKRYAFVLTHDVEYQDGHDFVIRIADVEQRHGFRSVFNFVPERYRVDRGLLKELRDRGFEVGVHGLSHDGRLFSSKRTFDGRVARINEYLRDWKAVGFRSPLTHRNLMWMQQLQSEYDSSCFDTDPYESMAGGTMSLWPFFAGRLVELPYTLPQDHTMMVTHGKRDTSMWLQKVDFIAQYGGMALSVTHPDYLQDSAMLGVFERFLATMRSRDTEYWHALPRDVARWWRRRSGDPLTGPTEAVLQAAPV